MFVIEEKDRIHFLFVSLGRLLLQQSVIGPDFPPSSTHTWEEDVNLAGCGLLCLASVNTVSLRVRPVNSPEAEGEGMRDENQVSTSRFPAQ